MDYLKTPYALYYILQHILWKLIYSLLTLLIKNNQNGVINLVKIKSSTEIDRKYREAIPRVAGAYKEGVQRTTDWQEKAIAGQKLFEEKMSDPAILARRGRAIADVSNEEWKNKASKLGAERIGRGMAENADKRARNYEPYRTAIEGASLPDRTADPMANIDNRVKGMVKVLVDKKKEIKG